MARRAGRNIGSRTRGSGDDDNNSPKRQKGKAILPPEWDTYRDSSQLAYPGWQEVPEPWTVKEAVEFIGFAHLDRWVPEDKHLRNCEYKNIKYNQLMDDAVKWRHLEIFQRISNLAVYHRYEVPKRIAAMIYAELVLERRVDWSTLHDKLRDNRFGNLGPHMSRRNLPSYVPRTAPPRWFVIKNTRTDDPDLPIPSNREEFARGCKHHEVNQDEGQERDGAPIAPRTTLIGPSTQDSSNPVVAGSSRSYEADHTTLVYPDLRAELAAYKAEMEAYKRSTVDKVRALEEEKQKLVHEMEQVTLNTAEMVDESSSRWEEEVSQLRHQVAELNAERKEMMLSTVVALARSTQFESELKSIAKEWTTNRRLRALLLTSWPRDETMYPSDWEDIEPSLQTQSGSLDWARVPGEDHTWDADKMLNGERVWEKPILKMVDGSNCSSCLNVWGPEGWYTVGTCGHSYHPQCLITTMILQRICTICKKPFHPRLYIQFGIRDFMPSHWIYREEDYPEGEAATMIGKPVEWSWTMNASRARIFWQYERAGTFENPDVLVVAAQRMYDGTPPRYGKKMFFYQCMGWTLHPTEDRLIKFGGTDDLYNWEGEKFPALEDGEERVATPDEIATMHHERIDHIVPLQQEALRAIFDDHSVDLIAWLEKGKGIVEGRTDGASTSTARE